MTTENDPIRKYQSELEKLKDSAERLRPLVRSCEDAILRADVNASVSVTGRDNCPKIFIMFMCRTLDEVVPLLRELAKEGLHTDKSKTHEDRNLLDVIAMREYNLGPQVKLAAIIFDEKDGDGPSCRMEQVSVKEVPVYEMKCDGLPV